MRRTGRFAIVGAVLALVGCGSVDESQISAPRDPQDPDTPQVKGRIGDLFSSGLVRPDGEGGGGVIQVNKYLWSAALDTLAFLPAGSTDPFSGVISTDWSVSPDAPGERMKVAAIMQGLQLEAGSLRVAVYRETRAADGTWVSAPVAGDTPRRLEDLILTRARQMRIAELKAADN